MGCVRLGKNSIFGLGNFAELRFLHLYSLLKNEQLGYYSANVTNKYVWEHNKMSGVILIGQNEAASLPADSQQTLATIGLFGCIAAVLQGSNGVTLVHVDSHTDPQFLVTEVHRLGSGSTIKLFKKAGSIPDLAVKIIEHLKSTGVRIGYDCVIEVTPVHPLPFGVVTATTKKSGQPSFDLCIKLAAAGAKYHDIDSGPQDLQMRSYTQQMFGYLNPDLHRAPTVIYSDDAWQDAFVLNRNDSNLLNFLFGIKPDTPRPDKLDPIELRAKVIKMLSNNSPGYKEKFANEYMKYRLGSQHGGHIYDVQFPALLERVYGYMQKTGLSFDKPIPKAESIVTSTRKSAPDF